jgi:integrase
MASGAPLRSCAAPLAGELRLIQLLLGHSSAQTTERLLGTKQDLAHSPNDAIKPKFAV